MLHCVKNLTCTGTKSYWRDDKAREPLFSWVTNDVLQRPTFKSFIALLDNYETSTGLNEEVTSEEIRENRNFIDRICETKVEYVPTDFYNDCPSSTIY